MTEDEGWAAGVSAQGELPIEPIPVPMVHDELSYLLMSDTFAHGHLTNPHSPYADSPGNLRCDSEAHVHLHLLPGSGLFLAIGQVAFGHPFLGAWLSGALCVPAAAHRGFKFRELSLAESDETPPRLTAYPESTTAAQSK